MTNQERLAEQIAKCSPEDAYEALGHLMISYAGMFEDKRRAVIEWLKEEKET